jgi:signal transduction histidine kinase
LNNLIANALAHTPAGGQVHVPRDTRVNYVMEQVQDTGSGISPEDIPHVFHRFYRGERSRPRKDTNGASGLGLGLAIARALVQAHDGHIGLRSELGQGTTVWFTLPQKIAMTTRRNNA